MIEVIKNIVVYILVYVIICILLKEVGRFFGHILNDNELYLLGLISVLFTNNILKD